MKYVRFTLFVAAVLAISTAAYARPNVRATVPFDFVVGDKLYPAGDYSLTANGIGSPVVQIISQADAHSILALTSNCSVSVAKDQPTKLVFQRVNGAYVLHQVWIAGSHAGRQFTHRPADTQLALNGSNVQEVVIAAQLTAR